MTNPIDAINMVNRWAIYYVANCIVSQVQESSLSFMELEDFKSSTLPSLSIYSC